MKIQFDAAKRDLTLRIRGLDIARALEIFAGPTNTQEDARRLYGERRYITVGFLDQRMVVLVWTERGTDRRIISLRKANEREQRRYGSALRR